MDQPSTVFCAVATSHCSRNNAWPAGSSIEALGHNALFRGIVDGASSCYYLHPADAEHVDYEGISPGHKDDLYTWNQRSHAGGWC